MLVFLICENDSFAVLLSFYPSFLIAEQSATFSNACNFCGHLFHCKKGGKDTTQCCLILKMPILNFCPLKADIYFTLSVTDIFPNGYSYREKGTYGAS